MNNNLKNILSYIKEAIEIKSKNIYDISDYEINLDLEEFYRTYKRILDEQNIMNININSEEIIFKLSYIEDKLKKNYPPIPTILTDYVYYNKDNDLIDKIDNIIAELELNGLKSEYINFEQQIKEINRFNSLIDKYNELYMDFYKIYKRITDYEEKIEVILGTDLLYWKNSDGKKIKRYILEANLELQLNPIENIIIFRINKDKFRGFATDFLNYDSYQVKETKLLHDFIKQFNENINNDDEVDLNEKIEEYAKYISLNNEIVSKNLIDEFDLKNNCTYIFNNKGIIVRNKNAKLWIEDLEKIIDECDTTKFTSPILNLFEINFENESQVQELIEDPSYLNTKDNDVLFPLDSNYEQYKIVDKVKSSNIVLVQGPPGTGKSHTIANLLSHYISEGKKVIVTSEKAKALEVVRNKLPKEIKSLSLALLSNTGIDKDLEYSIETIIKKQTDKIDEAKIKEKINTLSEQLNQIHQNKSNVSKEIIELMSKDTISYREELNTIMNYNMTNNLTLMEIAKWLSDNKQFKIIDIKDKENYEYIDAKEFFVKLDEIREEIKNNNYAISSNIPIHDVLNSNYIELHINEYISNKNYQFKIPEVKDYVIVSNLNENKIVELENKVEFLNQINEYFSKEWIKNNINYVVFINRLNRLKQMIEENSELIDSAEEKMFDITIKFDFVNINDYKKAIQNLLDLYDDNGNISLINKIRFKTIFNKLAGMMVNNQKIDKQQINKNTLIIIQEELKYYEAVQSIERKIDQELGQNLLTKIGKQENQFGKNKNILLNILDGIINYKNITSKIDQIFSELIDPNLFVISYMNDSKEKINNIIKDLKYYNINYHNLEKTNKIISDLMNFYKDYNIQNLNNLVHYIKENNLNEFTNSKIKLINELTIINKYNNMKQKFSKLMLDKENLIKKYIYEYDDAQRQFFKDNIDNILKYHYIEKFYLYLEMKNKNIDELFKKREQLLITEKEITIELIKTKGWYYQNKNMNYKISESLNRWIQLKKKLGTTMKRKNTNVYLRQMRMEMNNAKNAIPIWIMPVDTLIEQYPFSNEPPFDVLIMDESSQSSVFSISALARAKKIIIVGDDKQISPSNAFSNIDVLNELREKYLKGNKWALQISKETSIYDIIQTICGNKKIVLTEHFRCLPEIIHYSNKEFYNMEINPLKVRNKENTIDKPIEEIFVPNAKCKKIGTQIYNEAELNRIIDLIAEIAHDSKYNNKTIGIITLQKATRQIQKTIELLAEKFGQKFIEERKIKVGTTYDFQGDERDVIILSMMISTTDENGEEYHFRALTEDEWNKSFNVAATRAKEQMILIHSVELNDLTNPKCNRYKLLNYCKNYDKEEKKEIDKLFESDFERDMYNVLTSRNIKLTPQFKVGNYRLDFMVTNDNNQKLAIECDGDVYHSIEQLEYDLNRQSILERCGWKFIRIRASEFYYNREESIKKIIKQIDYYLNNNDVVFTNKSDDKIFEINSTLKDNLILMEMNKKIQSHDDEIEKIEDEELSKEDKIKLINRAIIEKKEIIIYHNDKTIIDVIRLSPSNIFKYKNYDYLKAYNVENEVTQYFNFDNIDIIRIIE